jgi:hypothetical protein
VPGSFLTPAERGFDLADDGFSRQRVPIIKASTLEDRTRPATEASSPVIARLRYSAWMSGWPRAARPASDEPAVGDVTAIQRVQQPYR